VIYKVVILIVHLLAAIKTTIQVIYDHSMTQAVSRRPLTAEARVLSQVSPCEIGEEQSVTGGRFFSEYFGFLLSI